MDTIMSILSWCISSGPALLTAIVSLLSAATVVAMLIPGDQPEKALTGIVAFLSKFSRKP